MAAEKPVILYDNVLEDATVTITSEAAGFPKENLWDARLFTLWKPTGIVTQDIDIDCGSTRNVDAFAIIGHDLGTQTATVEVFSATTAGYPSPVSLGTHVLTLDAALWLDLTAANTRYYRIRITSMDAVCFIGHISLGQKLTMPVLPRDGYDVDAQRVMGRALVSRGGHFLGAAVPMAQREIRAEFRYLTSTWVDVSLKPFLQNHYLKLKPFFYRPDPFNLPTRVDFLRAPNEAELQLPSESTYRHWTLRAIGLRED